MDPLRILAKPNDRIQLDSVNDTSLVMFSGSLPYVAIFFVFDHVWTHKNFIDQKSSFINRLFKVYKIQIFIFLRSMDI